MISMPVISQEMTTCPEGDKKQFIEDTINKILPQNDYKNYFSIINQTNNTLELKLKKYQECTALNSNIMNQILTLGTACDSLAKDYNTLLYKKEQHQNDFRRNLETLKSYMENLKIFYPTCQTLGELLRNYMQK